MNERIPFLRKKAMGLPLNPGVYLMKNKQGKIIYVGKAKALKNRVSQYFGSQNNHTIKVLKMVSNVYDFDYILTDSEYEALILECSLIKQHMPKYNILLKDDKGYHYIKINHNGWKTISEAKQMLDDDCEYVGPYLSGFIINQTIDEAKKIFKLPKCNKVFPRDIRKERPCLNFYIDQCMAPCNGKISKKDYNEAVDSAVDFIKGGSVKSVKLMQEKMIECSENLEFEKAAKLRDRINSINKINEKQKVFSVIIKNQDVFALEHSENKTCIMVLRFANGKLFDSEHFIFDREEDYPKVRYEFLQRFYTMRDNIPKRITLDGEVQDIELLSIWLTKKAGKKVEVTVPQKGEQLQIVNMCKKNAREKLFQKLGRTNKNEQALTELANLLGLDILPRYIESYDISHTAGQDNVAGMIVFKDGLPFKSAYKRFAIKEANGGDDCAAMKEVLDRRFNRYLEQKDTEKGFGKLPDLILLDGGQTQLNAVLEVLDKYKLSIPTFGMVKDSKHKTRAITTQNSEITISVKRQAFTLVSKIQEEVHRFAITYHHKKHNSKIKDSSLTRINGIGEVKAKNLMKHFKTIKAISQASVDELNSVKGINITDAKNISKFYNEEK